MRIVRRLCDLSSETFRYSGADMESVDGWGVTSSGILPHKKKGKEDTGGINTSPFKGEFVMLCHN